MFNKIKYVITLPAFILVRFLMNIDNGFKKKSQFYRKKDKNECRIDELIEELGKI